ncbi:MULTISPECIES: alpha/beta fold hydrolase [unclassified Saccharothrix]|uniref:alpha/beta fold hydrolase n=1 Tax=unclassified Saccharothrix TaxID=2593673 RepID=UPI00307F2FE8
MITGTAAGVPYVALPPRTGNRLVLVWHLLGEPGTPHDMAATLPLPDVDAWRVYPALPLRDPSPDFLLDGYAPLVTEAADAVPDLVTALRGELGCAGPVDVVGGSAGGHVALLTAVRGDVPVRRVAVVNPAVTAESVVEASVSAGFLPAYDWTPAARAAAAPLDVLAAADQLTAPLLVVRGEQEYPAFRPVQHQLCEAVPGSKLVDVTGLAHMLVTRTDEVAAEVGAWLTA